MAHEKLEPINDAATLGLSVYNLSDDGKTNSSHSQRNVRRGIETSQESPRRARFPPYSVMDTPEFMRRERKAKVSHVMTRATQMMINQSIP